VPVFQGQPWRLLAYGSAAGRRTHPVRRRLRVGVDERILEHITLEILAEQLNFFKVKLL
jgi:hypothetical protein